MADRPRNLRFRKGHLLDPFNGITGPRSISIEKKNLVTDYRILVDLITSSLDRTISSMDKHCRGKDLRIRSFSKTSVFSSLSVARPRFTEIIHRAKFASNFSPADRASLYNYGRLEGPSSRAENAAAWSRPITVRLTFMRHL